MNAEEFEEYRRLLCMIEINDHDGADIHDFEAYAWGLVAKYGIDPAECKPGGNIETWEFGLFNDLGHYGPNPKMGRWTRKGWMIGCRDMTKKEELQEIFPGTRSDHVSFRKWLAEANPLEFRCLERYFKRDNK